jgi:cell wall-associated NlpC family hydrolase
VPAHPSYRSFLRAVVITVSLAGGFGISTASAATATPTQTRAVSGSVTAGEQVRLAASVRAGAHGVKGLRLDLFRIAPSGRVRVTTVTTDGTGSVSASVAPAVTTRYYWRFAGTSAYSASGSRITITVSKAVVVPLGQRIVSEASRHLGAPYVYGATGPSAFDCSGFTQYVFGRLGVVLPRTAAQQYAAVRHVANADKRVGDLIFFRLGGGGIDHVGIYAGKNQIVVAPKTGDRVKFETIWTAYSVGRAG